MNNRRQFLKLNAAGLAAMPFFQIRAASPNDRLRVAVMGLGRGMDHIRAWQQVPNVEIAAVCDVDSRRLGAAAAVVGKQGLPPQQLSDFRRALEDKSIDVLSIAAPNFWHAPAAILACEAGKHVYVEKPGSHTAEEAGWMGAAAQKHGRLVQQGTQRRSLESLMEAVQKLKEGAIGTVRFARCWYDNARAPVRFAPAAPVPDWLNWTLWQGPATEQPYLDGMLHYNWHWRWHYGGGEMANNGVHMLDLALWAFSAIKGAPLTPLRVTCLGGRYHFQDDQETPDTTLATFDFGSFGIHFDASSRHQRKGADQHAFCTFYGDNGSLAMTSAGYRMYDLNGRQTGVNEPPFRDAPHFQNLADAIREGKKLHCDIATGQRSALLCHLANIAYRTSGALTMDPATGSIADNAPARQFWGKEYREGWKPKV